MLSTLLDYPDQELIDNLQAMRERLDGLEDIGADELGAVRTFLDWLDRSDLIRMQEDYVKTFDLTPEHSLHLTHHFFGDDNDRNRGPALIDLGELYKDYGIELTTNELPDYLPLILEFASMLEDTEAIAFLADANKVLTVLADNLASAGSPYAPLLSIVKSRATLTRLAA
jgi:nitrate reductase delta subunit